MKNMRKAMYLQYTVGLLVYYGVCLIGYWAYGTQATQYLPNQLGGRMWIQVLINVAVFLQSIISQHVSLILIYSIN